MQSWSQKFSCLYSIDLPQLKLANKYLCSYDNKKTKYNERETNNVPLVDKKPFLALLHIVHSFKRFLVEPLNQIKSQKAGLVNVRQRIFTG